MTSEARRNTMIDVAQRAGVSIKTVSRVLNNEPHVRPEVAERVRAIATELNYHPNLLARGLVRRRSHLLGLVYENPSPSYVVDLQMGVLDRLRAEPYRLIVFPVRSVQENADEVVGLLRSAALDAVVLAPPASDHPKILAELAAARIRFARIAPTRALQLGASNLVDDVAGAREIAAHLLALGHRRIGIIKGDPTHPSSEARLLGYSQAFHEAGLDFPLDGVQPGMFTQESGFVAAQRMLSGPTPPSAILAQNDDMAVGALLAARELGLEVPRDLSVAGFDNSMVSRLVWPPLTTVHQPVLEMATCAAEMLLTQLNGAPVPDNVRHPHQLIVRASTAPPPVAE